MSWARLVRLPNVFTVIADVSAAFLLVAHGPEPIGRLVCVVLAGILLYWAGMILNDVFDVEKDKRERSSRPLAAGEISIANARIAGFVAMLGGCVLAGVSGYVADDTYPSTWLPAAIAIVLSMAILLYDGPLKNTLLGPIAMGACRVLSFLLGASPLLGTVEGFEIPKYLFAIAIGMGTYIMGLTMFGSREADESGAGSPPLAAGTFVTLLGAIMLAFAPRLERVPVGWHVSTQMTFPILIGLVAFPVVIRAYRAVKDPTPLKIQTTMKIGILTIIPLAASFAFLGAGQVWGLVIFALVVPAMLLSKQFHVT
ncbi:prenyltransferase [Rubripirellula amarantea]|uniref:Prenyltransferase n=1 Tax=Rubripirellula amarantea TaxID=2527999 RepID=A0A5C5WRC8_9BACT|nr:UbiA family prenyltransferase [Rubripirellula amarantea]TWT52593.1 prenyltransferase [Rubripirellula amarantea]